MPSDFVDDFLKEIGLDPADPVVRAAVEDAEAQSTLIRTLAGVRHDLGLKQREVAERMETTQSRVSTFERLGGDPRLSTVFRYARAVDAQLRFFVTTAPCGWEVADVVQPVFTVDSDQDDGEQDAIEWVPIEVPA